MQSWPNQFGSSGSDVSQLSRVSDRREESACIISGELLRSLHSYILNWVRAGRWWSSLHWCIGTLQSDTCRVVTGAEEGEETVVCDALSFHEDITLSDPHKAHTFLTLCGQGFSLKLGQSWISNTWSLGNINLLTPSPPWEYVVNHTLQGFPFYVGKNISVEEMMAFWCHTGPHQFLKGHSFD